mmetsp:Transcript_50635/g.74054  ORF Transcript_50635/g.74054 Transcript_50635/m.74054 type:complete len:84 (-) Transcript_50635:99-350(-)
MIDCAMTKVHAPKSRTKKETELVSLNNTQNTSKGQPNDTENEKLGCCTGQGSTSISEERERAVKRPVENAEKDPVFGKERGVF